MQPATHIEINKSALDHNLQFIRKLIGESVRFSSVIKGNAYGHGIDVIVPLEEELGVDHFSVFSAEEAQKVLSVSSKGSGIMIMGMITQDQMAWVIENDIEFYVFDFDRLQSAQQTAQKLNKKALIHLELETGMNRTGFAPSALENIIHFFRKHTDSLNLKGVCTHFAGAESVANFYRIQNQRKLFREAIAVLNDASLKPELLHTACSAAAISYPETRMDMVRIGILQYGFFPSNEVLINYLTNMKINRSPLKRIISWKSKVMDIKQVKMGEFVGYGTSYFTNSDIRLATIPVGYSHGFSRSLSNQGRVLIKGQFANVVGMVNMNMISVDISNIDNVERGEEVVLIGKQGDLEITVSSFSDFSDQVNYELLTRLPSELKRVVTI